LPTPDRSHRLLRDYLTGALADLAQEGCKPAEALTYLLRALVLRREVGDTYHEANALDRLGFVYTALGQPQQAREAWNEAMIIYQAQLRADDAGRIQGQLDRFGYT
jgi:tetratricopeptide (TPR) repeat protein